MGHSRLRQIRSPLISMAVVAMALGAQACFFPGGGEHGGSHYESSSRRSWR
jgi:hypothetical protein